MESFSIWHWLVVFLAVAFWVAVGRYGYLIAKRAGVSGFLGGLLGVPLLNIIAIWYLALAEWPNLRQKGQ